MHNRGFASCGISKLILRSYIAVRKNWHIFIIYGSAPTNHTFSSSSSRLISLPLIPYIRSTEKKKKKKSRKKRAIDFPGRRHETITRPPALTRPVPVSVSLPPSLGPHWPRARPIVLAAPLAAPTVCHPNFQTIPRSRSSASTFQSCTP